MKFRLGIKKILNINKISSCKPFLKYILFSIKNFFLYNENIADVSAEAESIKVNILLLEYLNL